MRSTPVLSRQAARTYKCQQGTYGRPHVQPLACSCSRRRHADRRRATRAGATPAQDFPDGPMKQVFTERCGICHDLNRVRIGYTPDGWLMVSRMMQNMGAPVSGAEWGPLLEYLIKSFPERQRPAAKIIDGPVKVNIKMWDVPTLGSRPHD